MNEWIDELTDLSAAREPAVLVTVAGIRGSSPREVGAKMIVTQRETIGTIGGGQLEYQRSDRHCGASRSARHWGNAAAAWSKFCSNRSSAVCRHGCGIWRRFTVSKSLP